MNVLMVPRSMSLFYGSFIMTAIRSFVYLKDGPFFYGSRAQFFVAWLWPFITSFLLPPYVVLWHVPVPSPQSQGLSHTQCLLQTRIKNFPNHTLGSTLRGLPCTTPVR